eukprot:NODE_4114_length_860_cov_359.032059_g3796_i0.p2 GENE.NODE_4114_length_860_cov_359.032059_g3796_i0~~NODE_4114_length_860_cov_359.032059_g3796_i0.p2  ORF type:complete len:103 (-),score=23.15 NODE_4114_length_860_cov_359.032059_g3796_i0:496-804(-)
MFTSSLSRLAKTILPIGDRVLIQRVVTAKQTSSGVLIPESSVKKSNEGTVIEVGSGTKDWTMTVKKGDTVLLPEFGGMQIKVDDNDQLAIYRESEILGVVRE